MSTAIKNLPTEDLVAGLQRWAWHQGDQVRGAVELLVWHERWLLPGAFLAACAQHYPDEGMVAIRWADAAAFLATDPPASTTELAVLELAIALGTDRYRLGNMGHAHRAAVVQAITTAVGAR